VFHFRLTPRLKVLNIHLLSACMCSAEAAFFLSIVYYQQVVNLLCFTHSRSSEKRYYKGVGLTSFCHSRVSRAAPFVGGNGAVWSLYTNSAGTVCQLITLIEFNVKITDGAPVCTL
jgi:hypothetical protein